MGIPADDLHGAERRIGYLTEAVYRISGINGFDPTLRFELRKKATEILAAVARITCHPGALVGVPGEEFGERERYRALINDTAEIVIGLSSLVRFAERISQISGENANRIVGAYEEIRETLLLTAATPDGSLSPRMAFTDRQKRILAILQERGRAQLGELHQALGADCSGKTLQRELILLAESGLIRRIGGNRWSTYILAGSGAV